ncbi:MAG: class II aldolase/adducin family protein [Candidatus Thermoplasmatota archaeon]|nr:class II aldolase/adducin family protein [Candidatus Thermoplasmatota archaeon]
MIEKGLTNTRVQTFFISREQSSCPLVAELAELGKLLKERRIIDSVRGVISFGFGKRLLCTGSKKNLSDLQREDFLEIVDYDPVKNILLVIGSTYPCPETPTHWLVHRARADVNVIIQLEGKDMLTKIGKKIPSTENECVSGSFESTKEILTTLRKSRSIIIKNAGLFVVGSNLQQVEGTMLEALGVKS